MNVGALRALGLVIMAVELLNFVYVPFKRSTKLKKDHSTDYRPTEEEKRRKDELKEEMTSEL